MSGELIVGSPALLVIDMQHAGFLPLEASGIPLMDGYAERIDRVVWLVDRCRATGVPVIFFQEVHRRDGVDFGRELDGTEGVHCLEGDAGTDLVETLRPAAGDYFIPKRRYSCFFGTDLDILLRGLQVQTLLLVGGLTDVCVHYTFADAHQRDFRVRVLTDCVGGSSMARHEASLDAMAYLQRDALCTSHHVLAAIGEAVTV
jgi:nicotinamidase-related amidase